MDKKSLRNIERPVATEKIISQAQTTQKQYLAELTQYGDILQITFFKVQELLDGKTSANARTFVSSDDYITQDLTVAKTKWKTGRVDVITEYYWNGSWAWLDNVEFVDKNSEALFIKRFGVLKRSTLWANMYNWQTDVLERKRKERYHRELTETREYMALVPDKTPEFEEWVRETGRLFGRRLIYDAQDTKKERTVFCTYCKEHSTMDTRKIKVKNYHTGKCPHCGKESEFMSAGRMKENKRHDTWLMTIQPVEGGAVARYFCTVYHYFLKMEDGRYDWKMDTCTFEECRKFYMRNGKVVSFEYREYKQLDRTWCPDEGVIRCAKAIFFPQELREILQGTSIQYCALDVYQKNAGATAMLPIWTYLKEFPDSPFLELLVKGRMTKLVTDMLERPYDAKRIMKLKEKDIEKMFRMKKPYIRLLRVLDGGLYTLKWLQESNACNFIPSEKDARLFNDMFGEQYNAPNVLLAILFKELPVGKFCRYIEKQKKHYTQKEVEQREYCGHYPYRSMYRMSRKEKYQEMCSNVFTDWRDYIQASQELEYDVEDPYVLLPPNLKATHDRVMKEKQEHDDKVAAEKKRHMEEKIKVLLAEQAGKDPMEMKTKKLILVVPKDADDIRREGRIQHHCVATYVDRVARGETNILFIRKIEDPDTPYYTMEYADGHVVQCRGKRNCDMTPDVKAFVKVFEEKMREPVRKEVS